MESNPHTDRIKFRYRRLLIALGVCLSLVACGTLVLRQGWDPSYGPVVPHDTFPTDCSLCHVSGNWSTIKESFVFDHVTDTGTELHGAHQDVPCLMCHNDRGPVAVFSSQGCAGCHVDVHRGTLGRLCADCHQENNWFPNDAIARHMQTRFPLIGAHAAVACVQCHDGANVGNFEGLDTRCAPCHMSDLARATSPDHQSEGWTQECQRCHLQLAWKPAIFDHPASFPLSGAHGRQDCTACHVGGVFTGLSTDCVSCHLSEFQTTIDPNHVAAGFSTMCETCHGTNTWHNVPYSHPLSFPLTGRHTSLNCLDCHAGNVYAGLPSDCVDCHLSDYQMANNPNHVASGFSTNCDECHNTSRWQGAAFNHPFPLSGPHNLDCTDCHLNPGSYINDFSCTHCHEHRESESLNEHTEDGVIIPGYVWSSVSCYGCHPNGTH